MNYLPRLTLLLGGILMFAPACSSENLSTKGQLIECTQSASGPTDCHATDSSTPSAAGMCVDVDEDGDGDDHDEMEAEDEGMSSPGDDDGDGVSDADDADDDNDGIADDDDCDESAGGDGDD